MQVVFRSRGKKSVFGNDVKLDYSQENCRVFTYRTHKRPAVCPDCSSVEGRFRSLGNTSLYKRTTSRQLIPLSKDESAGLDLNQLDKQDKVRKWECRECKHVFLAEPIK